MNYQSFTNFSHTFIRRLRGGRHGAVRQDKVEEHQLWSRRESNSVTWGVLKMMSRASLLRDEAGAQ